MTFRPSIHGWPFANLHTVEPHVLGLGAPPAAELGLGGGLCWSALDRYLRGVRIPRDVRAPEPGEPLHAEIVRRQVAALSGVWPRVAELQDRPAGSWRDGLPVRVGGGKDLASATRREWLRIQKRLAAGEPVLLTLLEDTDRYRQGRAARQVLATGWTLGDDRVAVSLYDPDRPGDDRARLRFGPAGPLDARLDDGTAIRGFFAVPYDRASAGFVRAETFGDRSVIGMDRQVRGSLAPVPGRRRMDLVARDDDGALLHFRRDAAGHWEGTNVTERYELGAFELHSDPVALGMGGSLHVFGRSYVGDLLHFRLGRGWSVDNRTEHRRAGPRFRIETAPVVAVGPWRRISVLGLDKDGGLVHYTARPMASWKAEQVAGDPLGAPPVAAVVGSTLHVAGPSRDGRILHWAWDGTAWTPGAPATLAGQEGLRVAGGVGLRPTADGVLLHARSEDGALICMETRGEGDGWTLHRVAEGIAGDPVATAGPAGLHLFAARDDGGLSHAWREDDWATEDVLASRPALGAVPLPGPLVAWGSATEMRLWSRDGNDLRALLWRQDSDWLVERLSDRPAVGERHRAGSDPVVVQDADRRPHLFFTDGTGTVQHVEPADWQAPHDADEPDEPTRHPRTSGRETAGETSNVSESAEAMAPTAPTEPAESLEPTEAPGPAERAGTQRAGDAPDEAERPTPARRSSRGSRPALDGLPLLEDPDPLDDETGRPAADEPPPEADDPAAPATPADPTADLPYMDFEADPSPYANGAGAAQANGDGAATGEESAGAQDEGEEPAEKNPRGTSAAEAMEPMDLSLLDTSWPPDPPSPRKRERKKEKRPGAEERERETS